MWFIYIHAHSFLYLFVTFTSGFTRIWQMLAEKTQRWISSSRLCCDLELPSRSPKVLSILLWPWLSITVTKAASMGAADWEGGGGGGAMPISALLQLEWFCIQMGSNVNRFCRFSYCGGQSPHTVHVYKPLFAEKVNLDQISQCYYFIYLPGKKFQLTQLWQVQHDSKRVVCTAN